MPEPKKEKPETRPEPPVSEIKNPPMDHRIDSGRKLLRDLKRSAGKQ